MLNILLYQLNFIKTFPGHITWPIWKCVQGFSHCRLIFLDYFKHLFINKNAKDISTRVTYPFAIFIAKCERRLNMLILSQKRKCVTAFTDKSKHLLCTDSIYALKCARQHQTQNNLCPNFFLFNDINNIGTFSSSWDEIIIGYLYKMFRPNKL